MTDEDNEELLRFRQLWIEEVKQVQEAQTLSAMDLYEKGLASEEKNDLGPAVASYRAALKLDPEVEKKYRFRLEEERKAGDETTLEETSVAIESLAKAGEQNEDSSPEKELVVQMSKMLNQPVEIILLILQQVAITDLHSIFTLAQTCSMLSKLIKHDSVWSFVCEKLLIPCRLVAPSAFKELSSKVSWFERFKSVPHLRTDGIYISKVTYKRPGMSDLSVRLANLATVHIVTYYRYVRFLPGTNEALFLITHKEPADIVAKIRLKPETKKQLEGLIRAKFIWNDPQSVILKWFSSNQKNESEFLAHLILTSSVPGQHNKLQWANFASKNHQNEWMPFPKDQLKSFWFSRVRSY